MNITHEQGMSYNTHLQNHLSTWSDKENYISIGIFLLQNVIDEYYKTPSDKYICHYSILFITV